MTKKKRLHIHHWFWISSTWVCGMEVYRRYACRSCAKIKVVEVKKNLIKLEKLHGIRYRM
jgi:hypothetical protein